MHHILTRLAGLGTVAGVALAAFAAVPAAADQQLLACAGMSGIASLNPTLGSNGPRYMKSSTKGSDGTKTEFLSLAPIPADNLTCLVDAGIRTNNTVIDNGTGKYTLDDQTGGNAVLTSSPTGTPFPAKGSGSMAGAFTCNGSDTSLALEYPNSYPQQGKTTWKFNQADGAGKQIQLQQYIRMGIDLADTEAFHVTVRGIVIKGPGLGGDVRATLRLFPTSSTKNLNVLECTDTNVANDSTEASIAELSITQADGSDGDTAVDPWTVSIP